MTKNEKTSERKCWGRTKLTRRCQKSVPTGFFCSVHKMQPYVYLRRLLVGSIGLAAAIFTLSAMCGPSEEELKLEKAVYLDVDLACHSWKNDYMALYPEKFKQSGEQYSDVWEQLIKVEPPPYSVEEWQKCRLLFAQSATSVLNKLDVLLASHSDVISHELRLLMEKTKDQIEAVQSTYQGLPSLLYFTDDNDVFFQVQFQSMIRALTKLSREADRLRHEID